MSSSSCLTSQNKLAQTMEANEEILLEKPYLPDDLVFNIFLRLPVKSLLKLRCLSKAWLSLISSSSFTAKHLELSYRKHRVMYVYKLPELELIFMDISLEYFCQQLRRKGMVVFNSDDFDYDYPIGKHPEYFCQPSIEDEFVCDNDHPIGLLPEWSTFLGSCHGLLCVSSVCGLNRNNGIYLWNPSTRKSKKLPDIGKHWSLCLYSRYGYGFGYDNSSNDYKVVIISHNCSRLWIYSLMSGCWTVIRDFSHNYLMIEDVRGTFVNGKIYWIVKDKRHGEILMFVDIAKVSHGEVKQPDYGGSYDREECTTCSLGVLRGLLSLTKLHSSSMDLWIMIEKDDLGETWEKIAVIPSVAKPICISMEGDILMFRDGVGFELYNLQDGSLTSPPQAQMPSSSSHIDTYLESLVSLDIQPPRR